MKHRQPRYKQQKGQVDYLLLLLVIVVGVTAGNLLSNWITARIAAYQLEQSVTELTEQLANQQVANIQRQQQQNEQSRQQQEQRRQQIRNQRANSRTGLFLAKNCDEWKTTNQRYDNFTSQQEMRKACNRYEQFLETGITPVEAFN